MANQVGNESGSDNNSAYLKKLKEQQAAAAAAKLKAQLAAVASAKIGVKPTTPAFYQAGTANSKPTYPLPQGYQVPFFQQPQLNDLGQTPEMARAMSNYSDWYEKGAPNLAPKLDPNMVYQGWWQPDYGQRPFGVLDYPSMNDKGSGKPTDMYYPPGQMNTEQDRDILPDNWNPYTPPGQLPPPGPPPPNPYGLDSYTYPVYSDYGYGGGGYQQDSGINQWYANMVQWNINRPKGG